MIRRMGKHKNVDDGSKKERGNSSTISELAIPTSPNAPSQAVSPPVQNNGSLPNSGVLSQTSLPLVKFWATSIL